MLDKKTFTIGILSLCAVFLTAANLLQPQQADAAFVVKDRDYTAVTARVNSRERRTASYESPSISSCSTTSHSTSTDGSTPP